MGLLPVGIGVKTNGRSAWLDNPAAESYRRMLAAGCPTGGITDAGRTNAEQAEMYRLYLAGKLKATAAKPGTSKHETGRALDLAEPARSWVRAWGAPFGWVKDLVANEPWHFEYRADKDAQAKATPTPVTASPAPEEDDMSNGVLLVAEGRGHTYVVPAKHVHQVVPTEELELIKALGEDVVPIRVLSARQYDVAMAVFFQDTRPPQDRPDVHAVVSSIVDAIKALPAASGGLTAEQITAAVRAGINGARLTA